MRMSIIQLYQTVRKYAEVIGGISDQSGLSEVCDFGDSYGFLFETDDIYGNVYFCIDKKTYNASTFRPNQDMKRFMSRKIIPVSEVMP